MSILRFTCILFLIFSAFPFHAQAPNDSLANRITLEIDGEPFHSNTIDCTVEHNHLNKSITGQCIKYHNDQWFEFTPEHTGPCYITIMGQDCEDIRGVQLVVLSGIPFQPESYRSLGCVSSGHQDDFYLELQDLSPGQSYLINIDGYLHDFCSFNIHISSTLPAFSLKELSGVKFESSNTEKIVNLNWEMPDAALREINGFTISRRGPLDKHYKEIAALEIAINAFGDYQQSYQYRDSVLNVYGGVDYRIVANTRESRDFLVKETTIYIPYNKPRKAHYISFDPRMTENGEVILLLFDAKSRKMIVREETYISKADTLHKINITPFVDQGIHIYRLVRIENTTGRRMEYLKFKWPEK